MCLFKHHELVVCRGGATWPHCWHPSEGRPTPRHATAISTQTHRLGAPSLWLAGLAWLAPAAPSPLERALAAPCKRAHRADTQAGTQRGVSRRSLTGSTNRALHTARGRTRTQTHLASNSFTRLRLASSISRRFFVCAYSSFSRARSASALACCCSRLTRISSLPPTHATPTSTWSTQHTAALAWARRERRDSGPQQRA